MGFPTKNDHFGGCFFGVITTILGNLQLVSGRVPKLNELTGFRARISDWDIQGSDRCIRSSSLHIGKSLHATGIGFKWWSGLPWMFVYSLGIQSPSDNGNGTSIPCLGGDCTPQPSSNKAIGSLGIVATKTVVDILGIARAKTPVTQWIFFQCSIAIQFLWRKAYQPLVYPLFIYIYMPKRFGWYGDFVFRKSMEKYGNGSCRFAENMMYCMYSFTWYSKKTHCGSKKTLATKNVHRPTRWAPPTSFKWTYNPYK